MPEEVKEKLDEAKKEALQERKAQSEDKSPSAQPPQIAHHDSGGGSAQFKAKGGDNSIVEYGEEASAAEREEAARALHAYLDSLAAHRWAAACRYMAASLLVLLQRLPEIEKEQQGVEGCPKILATFSADTPQSTLAAGALADVASLRISGDRAFLIYRGAGGQGYVMPMAKEEGIWRVSSLAGTPAL